MTATLLPGQGYRCTTRNPSLGTTGDERRRLVDDPYATRIDPARSGRRHLVPDEPSRLAQGLDGTHRR